MFLKPFQTEFGGKCVPNQEIGNEPKVQSLISNLLILLQFNIKFPDFNLGRVVQFDGMAEAVL
jgi:hypothetical protein